jgi:hypothetical protein
MTNNPPVTHGQFSDHRTSLLKGSHRLQTHWVTGGLFVIESITTNYGFGVDDFPLGEKYDGRKIAHGLLVGYLS